MENEILKAIKQQSKNDLLSFCIFTDKFFEVNNHHIILAEKLQAFME
jgi:hypothetical protein